MLTTIVCPYKSQRWAYKVFELVILNGGKNELQHYFFGKFWLVSLVFVCFSFVGVLFISTASAAIDPANVVGMWLFDEGKGNVATDASENGLDGEFNGKPKWVDGKFGKGLELDGKAAYVQIPGHDNPNDAITVSIWVKSLSPTWNQHGWMVEKRNAYIIHPNQGTKNVSWPICNGGCWNKPGGWRDGEIGPKDIEEWHMYTTTFDSKSGEWYIYIDGKVASDMKIAKNPLDADSGPVNIGFDDCCGGARFGLPSLMKSSLWMLLWKRLIFKSSMTMVSTSQFWRLNPLTK